MEEESRDGDGLVEYIEDVDDKERLEEVIMEAMGYSNGAGSSEEESADEDDEVIDESIND
jgi:hypothetical protein